MKNTKFIACILGVVALFIPVLLGKFTTEYGLAVSGIVLGYFGGNTLITRAAIHSGKPGEP